VDGRRNARETRWWGTTHLLSPDRLRLPGAIEGPRNDEMALRRRGARLTLLVGVLVLIAPRGEAAAQSTPRPRSTDASGCKPNGGLFFEIDQRADLKVKRITATTKLFANGTWSTEVFDRDGTLAWTSSGCLGSVRLERIRNDLQAATWRVIHRDTLCRADSPRFTIYKWNGRTLYTDRTCNADVLDRASQSVLDQIERMLHIPDDLDGARACLLPFSLAPGCTGW
jgi:hypothetical protein